MSLTDYIKSVRGVRKLLILGSGAVGKTSLLKVLKRDKPLIKMNSGSLNYHRTPFMELESLRTSKMGPSSLNGVFIVYDVAGQLDLPIHAIRDFADTVVSNTDLILLMFSNNNIQSLLELTKWIKNIKDFYKQSKEKEPDYLLINNKIDLESNIDSNLPQQVVKNDPKIIDYAEISCLTFEGIENLKEWLVNYFLTTNGRSSDQDKNSIAYSSNNPSRLINKT